MMIEKSKVIVTGGAGFIGSHLVDHLLQYDNEVLVLDDFSSGNRDNLKQHESSTALTIIEADITDENALYELFSGVEYVFHLACRNVRTSIRQPTIVHDVNATGTLNVLKASANAKVRRFLYCSSSEVNGSADIIPMPEDYHFKPETIYGASKLLGEYYTQVFERSGWINSVIVRPHNNYGPREHYFGVKGEVIPRFILWALAGTPQIIYGDGKQTRDFTYVTETVQYMLKLMALDSARGSTFNLCRGEEVSIANIAELINEIVGTSLAPIFCPGRPSDVLRLYGDPSRLKEFIGDSPSISIREGLKRTVAWFRENVQLDEELMLSLQAKNWELGNHEPWLNTLMASKNE
ncbi:MAG: GDP-mannose 4,6-dehydratase [Pseudomonadota bacterium]